MQDASFFGYTTRTFIEIIFARQIANKSTYLSFNSLFFADADLPFWETLLLSNLNNIPKILCYNKKRVTDNLSVTLA